MPDRKLFPDQLPLLWVILLALAWLLPGLTSHDPWKQDEPYIFGIILHMLNSHDWVVPMNAGIPFMEKPPLYYWVASLLAHANRGWLPLYDGARLASGVFSAITLLFTGLSARQAWGAGYGRIALIGLIATFGLMYESHIMITDVPMIAGYAVASYGILLSLKRPAWGGWWLGVGTGIGFLTKGLLVPGTLAVTVLLLPVLFKTWRQSNYYHAVAIATLAALPWLLIWPTALYLRAPTLFYQWFWLNNVGRFFGFSVPQLGADNSAWFWPKTLRWFTWPILPLALLQLWRNRQHITQQPVLQFTVTAFVVYLAILQISASARTAYGLPMLISLSILAAPASIDLPAVVNRWGDYLARLLFAPMLVLIWSVWGIMILTGLPPHWHWLMRGLNAEFVMPFRPWRFIFAAIGTLTWLINWQWLAKRADRCLLSHALGITALWMALTMLWMPWIDNAKRFREVFDGVAQHLPSNYQCVAGIGLGESTRPMFDYYLSQQHILWVHGENPRCNTQLIDQPGTHPPSLSPAWQPIWSGSRPQDDKERFWLSARRNPNPPSTFSPPSTY